MARAWHYDGVSAVLHMVEIEPTGSGFRLVHPPGAAADSGASFSWAQLEPRGMRNGSAVYGLKGRPGWQIGFDGGVPAELKASLPRELRYGGIVDRFGYVPSLLVFAMASAALIAVVLRLPDWIAPNIPMSFEKRLGEAMLGDLSPRFCRGKDGEAALAALAKRVDPQGIARDVHVIRSPLLNAVTLPGGTILLFDGLLRSARSPDEIAGVLGHEIGHVKHRDVMQALVRQAGLSVMLGGFSGNIGNNMNSLLSASFSRAAETAADAHAIAALRAANVSPRDTAAFFDRLAKAERRVGPALAFVSSHPVSADRAAKFRSGADGLAKPEPALAVEQWVALAGICENDPKQRNRAPDVFF